MQHALSPRPRGWRPRLARASLATTAALALAVGLSACGSATGQSSSSSDRPTLRIGLTTPPTNMNPALNGSGQQGVFFALSNEPLTNLLPDGTVGPGLATSWKYVGSGNTTFTLTLRKDAKFADGTTVDAKAVKGWLDYFAKVGGFANNLNLDSVTTEGDDVVTLHLKKANPLLPYLLSQVYNIGDVASPAGVANPKAMNTQSFGAGPYMLDSSRTVTNDTYVYVPNPHYYDSSKVHYKEIDIKVISQPSSMLSAIQSGQIDVASGDYTTAAGAKKAGLEIIHKEQGWVGLIFLDRTGKLTPALGDPRVRQALNFAINRKAIVKGLFTSEYSSPTSQPPTLDGTVKGLNNSYDYDPAKAKKLLTEAGYPNGFTFSITSMSYTGVLGDPLSQAIAGDLAKVGVTMNISSAGTQAEYGTQLFSKKFGATEFVQYPVLPYYMFYEFYLSPSAAMNEQGWSDPTLNDLWQQNAVAEKTEATAQAMSAHCQEIACNLAVASFEGLWYSNGKTDGIDFSAATGLPYPQEWTPRK